MTTYKSSLRRCVSPTHLVTLFFSSCLVILRLALVLSLNTCAYTQLHFLEKQTHKQTGHGTWGLVYVRWV